MFRKSDTVGWVVTGIGLVLILVGTIPPFGTLFKQLGFSSMQFVTGGLFIAPGLLILLRNHPTDWRMRWFAGCAISFIGFVILWPFLLEQRPEIELDATLTQLLPFVLSVLIFFGFFFLAQGLVLFRSKSDGGRVYRLVWRVLSLCSFMACFGTWYFIGNWAFLSFHAIDPESAYRWLTAGATAISAFAAFLLSFSLAWYGWILLPKKIKIPRKKIA